MKVAPKPTVSVAQDLERSVKVFWLPKEVSQSHERGMSTFLRLTVMVTAVFLKKRTFISVLLFCLTRLLLKKTCNVCN